MIAERAIMGGEYTVAILGGEALPIIKIEPVTEFYDYEAKYLRDDTAYRCPCGLSEEREAELRRQAVDAFHVLGGRGWGRVDFLMDEAGHAYFLEVNTSPGMTDHSLVPMAARVAGISYDQLVLRVLALATPSMSVISATSATSPTLQASVASGAKTSVCGTPG